MQKKDILINGLSSLTAFYNPQRSNSARKIKNLEHVEILFKY